AGQQRRQPGSVSAWPPWTRARAGDAPWVQESLDLLHRSAVGVVGQRHVGHQVLLHIVQRQAGCGKESQRGAERKHTRKSVLHGNLQEERRSIDAGRWGTGARCNSRGTHSLAPHPKMHAISGSVSQEKDKSRLSSKVF